MRARGSCRWPTLLLRPLSATSRGSCVTGRCASVKRHECHAVCLPDTGLSLSTSHLPCTNTVAPAFASFFAVWSPIPSVPCTFIQPLGALNARMLQSFRGNTCVEACMCIQAVDVSVGDICRAPVPPACQTMYHSVRCWASAVRQQYAFAKCQALSRPVTRMLLPARSSAALAILSPAGQLVSRSTVGNRARAAVKRLCSKSRMLCDDVQRRRNAILLHLQFARHAARSAEHSMRAAHHSGAFACCQHAAAQAQGCG